jgi:hypothetical protein
MVLVFVWVFQFHATGSRPTKPVPLHKHLIVIACRFSLAELFREAYALESALDQALCLLIYNKQIKIHQFKTDESSFAYRPRL